MNFTYIIKKNKKIEKKMMSIDYFVVNIKLKSFYTTKRKQNVRV